MKSLLIQTFCLLFLCLGTVRAQQYQLASPNGKLSVTVDAGEALTWQIAHDGTTVLQPSAIALQGRDEKSAKKAITFGKNVKVIRAERKSVESSFPTPLYKKASVKDVYNQLTLKCRGGYSVQFRAYDDGAAYRFISEQNKPFIVLNETADFNFDKDYQAFVPYINDNRNGERYCFSFESYYDEAPLSKMHTDSLSITPLMVCLDGGKKAVIMEAGLENYPGMFLTANPQTRQGVQAAFAPYPLEETIGGHNRLNLIPTKRADYIARCAKQELPWRVVLVTEKDTQLADNDMAQRLAPACRIKDISWIKPGKVAWDWWNTWNLYGVDFKSGINNETYKYYIDFAADHGIEYVILDEGWAVNKKADLFQVVPEIDLPELVAYGKERGVGIVLWAGFYATERDLERVCKHYSEMGIKGFKVDFLDRDDQKIADFTYRLAETAAKYRLFLDMHGYHKPAGIQRTYPNVLNFEGVFGLEQMKWTSEKADMVTYDVTIPFIRMLAGPMDYTQGAMRNATRRNFRAVGSEAMSQGTRCRQLAEYVIFESPFNMLCDSPSNYMREPECTEFIASVPTTWDETVGLDGRVGEYVSIARRKGDTWYVGGMTDWNARTLTIDLGFLGEGAYTAELFRDGVNADKAARDYKRESVEIPADRKLTVKMAPGGGFALKITRK